LGYFEKFHRPKSKENFSGQSRRRDLQKNEILKNATTPHHIEIIEVFDTL
jgi:hypothetical protein